MSSAEYRVVNWEEVQTREYHQMGHPMHPADGTLAMMHGVRAGGGRTSWENICSIVRTKKLFPPAGWEEGPRLAVWQHYAATWFLGAGMWPGTDRKDCVSVANVHEYMCAFSPLFSRLQVEGPCADVILETTTGAGREMTNWFFAGDHSDRDWDVNTIWKIDPGHHQQLRAANYGGISIFAYCGDVYTITQPLPLTMLTQIVIHPREWDDGQVDALQLALDEGGYGHVVISKFT